MAPTEGKGWSNTRTTLHLEMTVQVVWPHGHDLPPGSIAQKTFTLRTAGSRGRDWLCRRSREGHFRNIKYSAGEPYLSSHPFVLKILKGLWGRRQDSSEINIFSLIKHTIISIDFIFYIEWMFLICFWRVNKNFCRTEDVRSEYGPAEEGIEAVGSSILHCAPAKTRKGE